MPDAACGAARRETPRSRSRSGLTPRQEAFCHALARGVDPYAAFREAYRCRRWTEETVRRRAATLAGRPEIKTAVWGLRSGAGPDAAVTIARLADELDEARLLAIDKGHSAAAVSATLGKAKLHGLPPDRKGVPVVSIESMSDDELDAYIRGLEFDADGETRWRGGPSGHFATQDTDPDDG